MTGRLIARPGGCRVLDLRGGARPGGGGGALVFPAGHRIVVTGLPGSGKSTLMRRAAVGGDGALLRIDSQDVRDCWAARLPGWLPYVCYRPGVRAAHYARLALALRGPASVIVHDSGRTALVRRWLSRHASRGGVFHLVVLDVPPGTALAGQTARGRTVPARAFARHRRAMSGLVAGLEAGRLPAGCASATLLDRGAAEALRGIVFGVSAAGRDGRTSSPGT